MGHGAPGLLSYAGGFGPPGASGSSESRPWLWTLPSMAPGPLPGPQCRIGGPFMMIKDKLLGRLQGLPLKRENTFIWEKPQWAWAFAFSTLPSRFYSLGCLPHFLVTGGQVAPWRRCGPVAQAASVKSRGFAASDRGGGAVPGEAGPC